VTAEMPLFQGTVMKIVVSFTTNGFGNWCLGITTSGRWFEKRLVIRVEKDKLRAQIKRVVFIFNLMVFIR
jgi:hypothetical protein